MGDPVEDATTRLNDEQIERYSRQLILQEVGPRGQERLGAARVAVLGTGPAAERVVAYLAAAGVGWIAADPAMHAFVDPAQPDCTVVELAVVGELDAAVVVGPESPETLAADVAAWSARASTTFWIAGGRAGGVPPGSAAGVTPPPPAGSAAIVTPPPPPELAALRDAVIGTIVATEVVKALLAIGTPLAERVLTYDPVTATITSVAVES